MAVAAYRDRITGTYPISLDTIRANAGVLFGEDAPRSVLDAANVDPVEASDRPSFDPTTEILSEGPPSLAGSSWHQSWVVTPIAPADPGPVVVFPGDLWRRTTDAEAEAIDAAMKAQPLRIRRLFDAAQTYQSDDPLWPLLMGAAVQLFGEARARELLAAS